MFEKLGYVTLRFDMRGCGESEGERAASSASIRSRTRAMRSRSSRKHKQVEPDRIGADRLELRRRGRGLCRRRRQAGRRGDLVRRLGRRRAQIPRPASDAGSLGQIHRHAGGRQAPSRANRQVADGAALRHRADPAASARPSCGRLDQMFPAETAQSMYDFRADDVVGKIAPRPLLLLHSSTDSVTPTEQSIEMFKRAGHADRPASVRRHRPFHVRGKQHARAQRDLRLARKIFPGQGASQGGVRRMSEQRRFPAASHGSRSPAMCIRPAGFPMPMPPLRRAR